MRTLSFLGLDAAERPRLSATSIRQLARLGTVVRWPGLLFAAVLSLAYVMNLSGQTITILEIAALLARLLGSSIEPQVTQSGRKFDIRHNTADITRAQQTLGFAPRVSLDAGFSELIEWAKTTPDVAVDFFDKALQELQDKGLLVKP